MMTSTPPGEDLGIPLLIIHCRGSGPRGVRINFPPRRRSCAGTHHLGHRSWASRHMCTTSARSSHQNNNMACIQPGSGSVTVRGMRVVFRIDALCNFFRDADFAAPLPTWRSSLHVMHHFCDQRWPQRNLDTGFHHPASKEGKSLSCRLVLVGLLGYLASFILL